MTDTRSICEKCRHQNGGCATFCQQCGYQLPLLQDPKIIEEAREISESPMTGCLGSGHGFQKDIGKKYCGSCGTKL